MKHKKVRHVLGISGGKDSAALAIYMHQNYPEIDIEYYTTDTGKELADTYDLIERLEDYLQKKIIRLKAVKSEQDPFDHFYKVYGGYLPSSNSRWCTKKLKLEPFESFVGDDPVVSYVGIRGDEDREGYISHKPNIQSIFPFRKNIWSADVISKLLKNTNAETLAAIYSFQNESVEKYLDIVNRPVSPSFPERHKLELLLELGIKEFNAAVFEFLKTSSYPLGREPYFPLLTKEEVLVKKDIFKILGDSPVGVPAYYDRIAFEVEGQRGEYSRSRSGCYFCFFQQKIEWVWLLEQHPEWYRKAMGYEDEKEGFTWNQNESLSQLMQPERVATIKRDYVAATTAKNNQFKSAKLVDILDEEVEGCAACFI